MRVSNRVMNKIMIGVIGSILSAFGAYLFYEKALLPVLTGVTDERAGTTLRHAEPFSFWSSVCLFGSISVFLIAMGAWTLWQLTKSSSEE